MTNSAALLLIICACRHYGWQMVSGDAAPHVWNICAALSIIALSAREAWRAWDRNTAIVFVVLSAHELAVILASAAYMLKPWPIPEGGAMLSSWVHFDMSKVGAFLLMLVLVRIVATVRSYR